jgi:hypothetical protein
LLSLIATMPGTKLNLTLYCGYGKAVHQLLLGKQPSSGPNAPDQKRAEISGYNQAPAPVFCIWMLGAGGLLDALIGNPASVARSS